MSVFVDIHVLQTLPPSNPNRDDTGAPKTAIFGGVRRMRISSQAIKRAMRTDFEDSVELSLQGIRSKRIPLLIKEKILQRKPDCAIDELSEMVALILEFTYYGHKDSKDKRDQYLKSVSQNPEHAFEDLDVLWFVSHAEIDKYVDAVIEDMQTDDPKKSFKLRKFDKASTKRDHSIAVALFGRMVASNTNLQVEAACQVAPAIGVGAMENEYDYYTAVDDHKNASEDSGKGAAMIGMIEFASATMYRYSTINVDMLRENLSDDNLVGQAIELFVNSYVRSMPQGKITTFGNRSLPEAVLVEVRSDQPINMAAAFEEPIAPATSGFAQRAVDRFVEFESQMRELTGLGPDRSFVSWTTPRGESFSVLGNKVRLIDLGSATSSAVRGMQ